MAPTRFGHAASYRGIWLDQGAETGAARMTACTQWRARRPVHGYMQEKSSEICDCRS